MITIIEGNITVHTIMQSVELRAHVHRAIGVLHKGECTAQIHSMHCL
jgi:hypothetical protein